MKLTLADGHLAAIHAHVQQEFPREGCGLIAGRDGVSRAVHPVRNALQSSTAFMMDPIEQIQTMTAMFDSGLDVVGIYHSHPFGPDVPSFVDIRQHAYPEAACLISTPLKSGWRTRAFRIHADTWSEIELCVTA
ncbi:MAG: M67 family metallopeptidase [Chloroflexi bacterium]|nr:M67 family metallopeptidase [Chloroflexota bacterium]